MGKVIFALIFIFAFSAFFLNLPAGRQALTADVYAEEVTITTYYPAPEGVYKDLWAEYYSGYPETQVPGEPIDTFFGLDPNEQSYLNNLDISGTLSVDYLAATAYYDTDDPSFTPGSPPTGDYFIDPYPANPDDPSIIVDGDVGIGTTSPDADIHIFRNSGDSTNLHLQYDFTGLPNGQTDSDWLFEADSSFPGLLNIKNPTTSRLTITNAGNVGIGTERPNQRLVVQGNALVRPDDSWSTGDNALLYMGDENHYIRSAYGTAMNIKSYSDPITFSLANPISYADQERLRISNYGHVTIGYGDIGSIYKEDYPLSIYRYNQVAVLRLFSEGGDTSSIILDGLYNSLPPVQHRWTISNRLTDFGKLIFYYGTSPSPKMTLDQDGQMGLRGVTAPTYTLQLPNSSMGNIGRGWAFQFIDGSSIRWKTDIKPIKNALEKTMELEGVTFKWKDSGNPGIGLIAEEVGKVIPEVVSYEENGKDANGISYDHLVALLVEAIKEQQKQIENLNKKIVTLEAKLK